MSEPTPLAEPKALVMTQPDPPSRLASIPW
jgi:hypothetical protein